MVTNRYLQFLKRHVWLLAAFFIPLAIRSIPEIISWPYPLGLDTLRYLPIIESGRVLSDAFFFLQTHLFYSIGTLAYWLTGDGVLVIKIFGPLLMGLVAVMMYLYAKRSLGWGGLKSFLVSLLVATYFVSLRNSWDLYAQSFALIFLFATLIVLKSFSSPKRYAFASVFMLLTVLGHQLVAVILFVILGLEALRVLAKKSYKEFVLNLISLSVALSLFLFQMFSPSISSIILLETSLVSLSSVSATLSMASLLVYCYALILPFVAVGVMSLKDWFSRFWAFWCLGAIIALMIIPTLPLYFWNRWVYLLVYPLLFFTVEGLDILWGFWSSNKNKIKRYLPRVVAAVYVGLLLCLSGFYLCLSPQDQIAFFSDNNQNLVHIPSSMLQNTIPISDNPSLHGCFNWINANLDNNSVLVVHYSLYDLAKIYANVQIVNVNNPSVFQNESSIAGRMIEASQMALVAGNTTVYTIWWRSGEGWYQIPSLPSHFKEVYCEERMAVYIFDPSV